MSLGRRSRGVTQFNCTGGHWPCAYMHQQKTSTEYLHLKTSHFTQFCFYYLTQDSIFFFFYWTHKYPLTYICPTFSYRLQLEHLFFHLKVFWVLFFYKLRKEENGNQVLGNYKLLVFPSKRQREEQAKPPASGAASFHSNSCPVIHQQVRYYWSGCIWKAHPQTHIMGHIHRVTASLTTTSHPALHLPVISQI